ncbi:MAG: hypothetical protein J3K34DRAFT_407778 [Monoraphidium minutum]|nr:MAG: hypothetical protein J3K34DRAFT_407778 [Monoraphidium minutum]
MVRKMQLVSALLALALIGSATARPLSTPEALALALATSSGEPQVQLDICNLSDSPSMTLTATPEGECLITNRVLPAAGANSSSPDGSALQFKFKCGPSSLKASPKIEGPALNLWAGLAAGAEGDAKSGGMCALTTLNPVLYFHRQENPLFHYGYTLSGLPCKSLPAGDAAVPSADDLTSQALPASAATVGVVYGLALVPSLPTPSMAAGSPEKSGNARFYSTEAQQCKLLVTAMGRAFMYESKEHFPCAMVVNPEKALGAGRCFGGAPVA